MDRCRSKDVCSYLQVGPRRRHCALFDPGTGDFTVEAWAKTTVNGNQVIATKGTNWQLAVTSDAGNVGKAWFSYANGAITAYSTGRVDDGNWHHIMAVVKRPTGVRVYVDGVGKGHADGVTAGS